MKKINALRPHSTPATLSWLEANYEPVEGVCIPRCALYKQYTEFCFWHHVQPVNAASFGKIIRQKFPKLTTRRLGTRGKSRYHYYGIAVKPESEFYDRVRQYYYGVPNVKSAFKPPPRVKRSTDPSPVFPPAVLSFPSSEILAMLPSNVSKTNAENILVMYKLHCSQIIEYATNLNYHELENCIVHFWGNFPAHLTDLLGNTSVVHIIAICDAIAYHSIVQSGIPIRIEVDVPSQRVVRYVTLSKNLISWLMRLSPHLPLALRKVKLHLAKMFEQTMRRHSSINNMSNTLRQSLAVRNLSVDMLQDWERVDIHAVIQEATVSLDSSQTQANSATSLLKYCKELESLMVRKAPLDEYSRWISNILNRCIRKRSTQTPISPFESLQSTHIPGCDFVLIWTSVGKRLLTEFTLHGAKTFGTFHLLYLFVNDIGAQFMEETQLVDKIKRLTTKVSDPESPAPNTTSPIYVCVCKINGENTHCTCRIVQSTPQVAPTGHHGNAVGSIAQIQGFQDQGPDGLSQSSSSESLMADNYLPPGDGMLHTPPMRFGPDTTTVVSAHRNPIYASLPMESSLPLDLQDCGMVGHVPKPFQQQEPQPSSSRHSHYPMSIGGFDGQQYMHQESHSYNNWGSPSAGSSWQHLNQSLLRTAQPYPSHSHYSYHPQQSYMNYYEPSFPHQEHYNEQFFTETAATGPDGNYYRINTNVCVHTQNGDGGVVTTAIATATVTTPLEAAEGHPGDHHGEQDMPDQQDEDSMPDQEPIYEPQGPQPIIHYGLMSPHLISEQMGIDFDEDDSSESSDDQEDTTNQLEGGWIVEQQEPTEEE